MDPRPYEAPKEVSRWKVWAFFAWFVFLGIAGIYLHLSATSQRQLLTGLTLLSASVLGSCIWVFRVFVRAISKALE